jgi:serine-type D-Ala-D-Ala carboxypeptidase/endopeptidase (penicillin-binding protein 4)
VGSCAWDIENCGAFCVKRRPPPRSRPRPRDCACPSAVYSQNFCVKYLFRTPALIFFSVLSIIVDASAQEPKPVKTLADLQQELSAHVAQPKFDAALWGVKVVSLDSGKVIFEQNSQKLFSPASNSKLYTVALALERLGADYRIKTSLYAAARPNAGVLKGDLIVFGRGDPTINARLHNNDIYAALEPFVVALTNAGVQSITGDLIGDDSYFHGPPYGSGWAWDDTESYYGAEISALTINDNTLQVSVKPAGKVGDACALTLSPATTYVTFSNRTETATNGVRRTISFYRPLDENVIYASGIMPVQDPIYSDDVTVHSPAGLFIWLFREALARHGIKVGGKLRTVNWLDRQVDAIHMEKLVELGSVESLPLSDIAREVMKPSQNLYTDLLLAHVGEQHRTPQTSPNETSEELGIRELNKFLGEAAVKRGDVFFEEGSGLSRNNLTTPNATIALLQYMSKHKCAEVYLNALPIAGIDGTLRNRMKGTAAAGNVRAKTGTLRWANSLSGHVTTAAGERLLFSIMLNRYHNSDPNRSGRADIDAIAVMLAEFNGHVAN